MNVHNVTHALIHGRLRHAWIIGLLCVIYIWWFAPLQIDKMILVTGKIFIGAIIGIGLWLSISRYFYHEGEHKDHSWMWACIALMIAGMYCMSQAV